MSEVYDNWEKLVGAVLRKEKDRQLAYCESLDSSSHLQPISVHVSVFKPLLPEIFMGLLMVEISHLRHPNLFTPIGYCFDTDQTIFVYEFMHKGSLEKHLFTRGLPPLSWATMIKVAIGVAKGLAFLHSLERPVMHRNINCSTIFLDDDLNAKLRDFDATLPDISTGSYSKFNDIGFTKGIPTPTKGFRYEIEGPLGIVVLQST